MRLITPLLVLLFSGPVYGDESSFWRTWSDGQAEVSGYRLTQPRYGESRSGHAILIFVTEPFSRSRSVKVDRYNPKDPDHFTALKLNHLQRFRTGVYDYSIMTSLFTDPSRGFRPVKQTFSSQEWCGHVYEEVIWRGGKAHVRVDSYFERESRTGVQLGLAASEDALWIIARGLMAEGPGVSIESGPMVGRSLLRRLRHQDVGTFSATPQWSAVKKVKTPAGSFLVRDLSWVRPDKISCRLQVEVAAPHRIIGWSCDDGERAELTGSRRLPYWRQVSPQNETLLKVLGLPRESLE